MLERTAGCLEQGSLRRLLPASKTPSPSRSCRKLHSGFWAHGGGEIELSPFWPTFVQTATHTDSREEPSTSKVQMGSFVLDFLYPTGALNLLRQCSLWNTDRQEGRLMRYGSSRIGHRQYTSLAKDESVRAESADASSTSELPANDVPAHKPKTGDIDIEALFNYIPPNIRNDFSECWREYQLLSADVQYNLRPHMLRHLSTSDREVDAQRAICLFEVLNEMQKTETAYRSLTQSYLTLRNLSDAMSTYTTALEVLGVPAGSAEILTYLLDNKSWIRALNLWEEVTSLEGWGKDYEIFQVLGDGGRLYFRALELAEDVNARGKQESTALSDSTAKLLKFDAVLIRRALVTPTGFSESRFRTLLKILQEWKLDDSSMYQEAVDMLLKMNERKLALWTYRNGRATTRFNQYTLGSILKNCCEYSSVQGINEVLDDFIKHHGRPSTYAYQRTLQFFAAKGDSRTVHALWDQYISLFNTSRMVLTANDFTSILHVHAVRGEIHEVLRWFEKITATYQLTPTIWCWNILLNAYGRVKDYDNAYNTFQDILENPDCDPTDYTFGTMMSICTREGDIDRTIEVYAMAEEAGVPRNCVMLTNLVLTNIQESDLEEAERICTESLDLDLPGEKIRMWNCLLGAHARRFDLNAVYRVLQLMSEARLKFTSHTYVMLMQALVMLKQPDRAYAILKDVMPEAGVRATSFHYSLLMNGYLRVNRPKKALEIQNRMRRREIRGSPTTKLSVLEANLTETEQTSIDGSSAKVLERAMALFEAAMESLDAGDLADNPKVAVGQFSADVALPSLFYSYIMRILASMGNTESVDELYDKFLSDLPDSRQEHTPLEVMSALMLGKLRAGDHASVEKCWDICLKQAKARGKPLPSLTSDNNAAFSPYKIVPIHQLDLAKHAAVYLESLHDQHMLAKMVATVSDLLEDGFRLDNKTWNDYIRQLARKGQFDEAFKRCELHLMDNWTGWQVDRWKAPVRNRLPVQLRYIRRRPNHLRPTHITLLYLARSLLDVQEMAAESRANERMLEKLRDSCPRTTRAIEQMPRADSEIEREILGKYH